MISRKDIEEKAHFLGAKKGTIQQWKKKGRRLPYRWQILLSEEMGVTPDEIIKGFEQKI